MGPGGGRIWFQDNDFTQVARARPPVELRTDQQVSVHQDGKTLTTQVIAFIAATRSPPKAGSSAAGRSAGPVRPAGNQGGRKTESYPEAKEARRLPGLFT